MLRSGYRTAVRSLPLLRGAWLALLLSPVGAAHAAWPDVRLTGFVQPGFEFIHADPATQTDAQGFSLGHARALGIGEGKMGSVTFDLRLEVEGSPQFSLFDAYVAARGALQGDGSWRIVAGQHKAPFSRQILVWEPDLQMLGRHPDGTISGKAWLTELAPGHQLGVTGTIHVPFAPWIELSAGAYNGKGRNHVENVDKNFMYVGRLALRPIGPNAPLVESGLGDNQVSIAVDASYNVQNLGDYNQTDLLFGADAFGCWRGLSGYGEFLWGSTQYTSNTPMPPPVKNYHSLGYNAQLGYLLPFPGRLFRRFEIVGRFEGILRNDSIPIAGPGDPNQTHYAVVAGINYFQRGHSLKGQFNYQHYILTDDTGRGAAGKAAQYDAVFIQLTYKLE
jgi:hypothetical protein